MNKIDKGYKAFNGYIFTEADAKIYNNACDCPMTTPDQLHNLFMIIIFNK